MEPESHSIRTNRRRLRAVTPRTFRLLDQTPGFVADAVHWSSVSGYPVRPPKEKVFETSIGPITLAYRVTGWRYVSLIGLSEEGRPVRHKHLFGTLKRGDEEVGAVEVMGYNIDAFHDNEEIWAALDSDSYAGMTLADALVAGWEDAGLEVAAYGPVIDFRNIWVRHAYARGSWWAEIAAGIVRLHSHRPSAVFANLYALEFEGCTEPGSRDNDRLSRRRAALVRMCRRHFGMAHFYGSPRGEVCWVWVPMPRVAGIIDPPVSSLRP